jgi:5-methyltetrahydrofolate--homocysteine methyltransferase
VNEEFSAAVGADAYCRDAAVAAETAKRMVIERRGEQSPALEGAAS